MHKLIVVLLMIESASTAFLLARLHLSCSSLWLKGQELAAVSLPVSLASRRQLSRWPVALVLVLVVSWSSPSGIKFIVAVAVVVFVLEVLVLLRLPVVVIVVLVVCLLLVHFAVAGCL